MWKRMLWGICLGLSVTAPCFAAAQDELGVAPSSAAKGADKGAPVINPGAIYVPLKPAFVVNYGGPGRLKYLKADISLRVGDAQSANSVRHHMPYIRNNLVMLFSAQTDESIGSQEGKEALRREALQEVRNVLLQEEGHEDVVDLYFNEFLINK
jgi:flagellar FliL protein